MICVDVVHGGDADDYVDVGDVVDAVVVQDLQLILLHPGADHHKLLDKPKDVRPGKDHDGCNGNFSFWQNIYFRKQNYMCVEIKEP